MMKFHKIFIMLYIIKAFITNLQYFFNKVNNEKNDLNILRKLF